MAADTSALSTTPDTAARRRFAVPAATLALLLGGVALSALLHVVPATRGISATEDTISEYAFSSAQWLFNIAVLLVAAGPAVLWLDLIRSGAIRVASVTSVFGWLWTLGLALVVVFEKTDWAVGPSLGGTIHRYASIVAFLALPVAVIAAAGVLFRTSAPWRVTARVLGASSLLWFGIIFAAILRMAAGGPPWWRSIPLGLVERGMVLNELLAVTALAAGMLVTRARTTRASHPAESL